MRYVVYDEGIENPVAVNSVKAEFEKGEQFSQKK